MNSSEIEELSLKISSYTGNNIFDQQVIQDILTDLSKYQPQYQELGYLSHGGCSLLLKAKCNQKQIALKIVECSLAPENIELVRKEYSFLSSLKDNSHFAVVNKCFYLRDQNKEECEKQKPKYFIIDMNLYDCNLIQLLSKFKNEKKEFENDMKEIMVIQLLDVLNTLHSKGIIHRNIKSTNILVSYNHSIEGIPLKLKLSDLGMDLTLNLILSFYAGIIRIVKHISLKANSEKQKKQSDLFSLGIVILEIDNFNTFERVMIEDVELCNLQKQGIKALHNHKINTNSSLFQIASSFLEPNQKMKQSAQEILLQFLQKDKYANTVVYSTITQQSVSTASALIFPSTTAKKVEEIVTIQDSIKKYLLKNNNAETNQTEKLYLQQIEHMMYLTNQEIQNLEQIDSKQMSSDQVKSALKFLYEQNKFSLFSYLGGGSAGITFLVNNIQLNRESVIRLSLVTNKLEILREISVLQICHSPYIVEFYGYELFEDQNKDQFAVLEFQKCDCSLMHYLDENKAAIKSNADLKMSIALQVMDSVNTLHRYNVLHGNVHLKSFYILEDRSGKITVKLSLNQSSAILQDLEYCYDSVDQLLYKNYYYTTVNCLYLNEKGSTLAFRSPEKSPAKGFPSTFLSDSYSVGLCLLLLDNYSSFQPVFVKNYIYLLQPYQVPFMNCYHLINKDTQIYKWSASLLTYDLKNRLFLREIIDQIKEPLIPLHSKFHSSIPQKNNVQQSSCFFFTFNSNDLFKVLNFNSSMLSFHLKSLYLLRNTITGEGVLQLSSVLSKMTQLQSLSINLSLNKITSKSVISLSQSLCKLNQLSNLSLDLNNNEIQSEGFASLISNLSQLRQLSNLVLHLSKNQIIVFEPFRFNSLSNLKLNLSDNKISRKGLISLNQSLSHLVQLSSLTLDLHNNLIINEDVGELSSSLSELQYLQSLTLLLSNKKMTDDDVTLISLCLTQLKQLSNLTINLSKNKITNKGVMSLSSGLSKLNELISLNISLSWTQVTSESIIILSTFLSKMSQLTNVTLYLSYNKIFKDEDIKSLSKGISLLNQLSSFHIYLLHNQIPPYIQKQLQVLNQSMNSQEKRFEIHFFN